LGAAPLHSADLTSPLLTSPLLCCCLLLPLPQILAGLTSPPQDLSYNGTNNLLDPRDIGIAAGRAVHAYGLVGALPGSQDAQ
jgi:hypothetical protein